MSNLEFLRILGELLTALWTLQQNMFQLQDPLTIQEPMSTPWRSVYNMKKKEKEKEINLTKDMQYV